MYQDSFGWKSGQRRRCSFLRDVQNFPLEYHHPKCGAVSEAKERSKKKRQQNPELFRYGRFRVLGRNQKSLSCTKRVSSYPKLVREVQPPHIYVRGDGRLKLRKQSSNINTSTFSLQPLFLLPFLGDFAYILPWIDNRAWSGQIRPSSAHSCRNLRQGPS